MTGVNIDDSASFHEIAMSKIYIDIFKKRGFLDYGLQYTDQMNDTNYYSLILCFHIEFEISLYLSNTMVIHRHSASWDFRGLVIPSYKKCYHLEGVHGING